MNTQNIAQTEVLDFTLEDDIVLDALWELLDSLEDDLDSLEEE